MVPCPGKCSVYRFAVGSVVFVHLCILTILATFGCLVLSLAWDSLLNLVILPKCELISPLVPLDAFRHIKLSRFAVSFVVFCASRHHSYFSYLGLLSLLVCLG